MQNKRETEAENGMRKLLFEGTRKVFLAGLGAVMLAQDELTDLAESLVERGETSQEKGRRRVEDFVTDRKKYAEKVAQQAEKRLDERFERLLHRMNVPTRSEIKSLNANISRLSKKVDALKKASS